MNRISKPPEIRKQEIMDEAKKLFLEKGYENTSMTDIASAIHVTEGLCYRYYKSKQELFKKVIDEYVEDCCEKFMPVVASHAMSFAERIRLNFKILAEIETPNGMNKYFHDEKNQALHFQIIYKIINKLFKPIEEILSGEQKKGTIQIDDAADMARFILFGSLGVLLSDDLELNEKEERITGYVFKILGYCETKSIKK